MHGASSTTPVTIVENASMPNQNIVSTTLRHLAAAANGNESSGPAVILLGLNARVDVADNDSPVRPRMSTV